MPKKLDRRLRVGVLGCGPIAQAAHFESCTKAANADLYAICDVADDLRARMAATHAPEKIFADYDAMLADPDLEAVIIATSDSFHVPAAIRALEAGKHVLCEKPVATSVEAGRGTAEGGEGQRQGAAGRPHEALRRGPARRPPISSDDGMGEMVALKAWYCDSTHRYPMTDAVQPLMVSSANARKPAGNPKADLDRYYMLAHGSHLVDTARFFAGEIVAVDARQSQRGGMRCWFVDVEFANGVLGHLDLTVAVRMDWHEGFQIYGENGSIVGKTFNPWYYKSSEVDIFHEAEGGFAPRARRRRPFLPPPAGRLRRRHPQRCADEGRRHRRRRRLGPRHGRHRAVGSRRQAGAPRPGVGRGLMRLGIFAKTFAGTEPGAGACGGRGLPASRPRSTTWPAPACRRCRMRSRRMRLPRSRGAAQDEDVPICAVSGTYNMAHPDPAVRAEGLRRLEVHRGCLRRRWARA